jgi:cellobiose-specific phosphotransferase system component IIA
MEISEKLKDLNSGQSENQNPEQSGKSETVGHQTNAETESKFEFDIVVNGKSEKVVFNTKEELANAVQLSRASTQRFQEASNISKEAEEKLNEAKKIYEELAKNETYKKPVEHKKPETDYDDDVYSELNKTKKELEQLKNMFNEIGSEFKSKKLNDSIHTLIEKYGVDRDFIEKTVTPFMAREGIDNLEIALKAVLFENGKSNSQSITTDGAYRKKVEPSIKDQIADEIISFSDKTIFNKMRKR